MALHYLGVWHKHVYFHIDANNNAETVWSLTICENKMYMACTVSCSEPSYKK